MNTTSVAAPRTLASRLALLAKDFKTSVATGYDRDDDAAVGPRPRPHDEQYEALSVTAARQKGQVIMVPAAVVRDQSSLRSRLGPDAMACSWPPPASCG